MYWSTDSTEKSGVVVRFEVSVWLLVGFVLREIIASEPSPPEWSSCQAVPQLLTVMAVAKARVPDLTTHETHAVPKS